MASVGQLVVVSPGDVVRVYFLEPGTLSIGRDPTNGVVLRDVKVSRRHARLVVGERVVLEDAGSASGCYVNNLRVERATLSTGDEVRIGGSTLRLALEGAAADEREEFVTLEADQDPTLVESLADADATVSAHAAVPCSLHDVSAPRLSIVTPGRVREVVLGDEVVLGRAPECDVVLDDDASSRKHAVLARVGRGHVLRDLGSRNGTWFDGKRVGEQPLAGGDNFRIGDTLFVYKPGADDRAGASSEAARAPRGERWPVVVIPGVMGSELYRGDELLWPTVGGMSLRADQIAIDAPGVEARAIARHVVIIPGLLRLDAYSLLVQFLVESLGYRSGEDLLEYPYDWRKDNRVSARGLRDAIDAWRRDVLGPERKVTIVAHSMGTLVARYFVERLGGRDAVRKLLLLGGPHSGAPHMVQALLWGPKLLPLGLAGKKLHRAIVGFPACYQLVPTYPCAYDAAGQVIDLFADPSWVEPAYRPLLADAAAFHAELPMTSSVPCTCIFGYGMKTLTKIFFDRRGAQGWDSVRFQVEKAGDNRVHERQSSLEGAEIHPVQQFHGSLWTDPDVQMRLRIELLR